MRVDSHQHFWSYDPIRYSWIDDRMEKLRRAFLPGDLKTEMEATGIDRVVSVQARQDLEETQWLLALSREFEYIAGVVGWVPLISSGVEADLERMAGHPRLKGIRHVLQDESDDRYMLREDFNRGLSLLPKFGLVYDILIYESHLPQTIEFVDLHPLQIFVLDHVAKPRIRDGAITPWRENLRELARRENVYCKISGMATEGHWESFNEDDLLPYLEVVLEAFGPDRLMFGSDWPVCLLACDYGRWVRIVRDFIGRLSSDERDRIEGGTALEAYGLG